MTKGEETRQFIIESSAALFNTKGISGTAMSDIMEATKLSKGSLYVHFEDKDDLANKVVDYSLNSLKNRIVSEMAKAKSARDKLFTYIDIISDAQNFPVKGGCPMINFGSEADDTNQVIGQRVSAAIRNSLNRIVEIVDFGKANGEFDKDWNSKEFATTMFAMLEGGIFIGRSTGSNVETNIIARHLKNLINSHSL